MAGQPSIDFGSKMLRLPNPVMPTVLVFLTVAWTLHTASTIAGYPLQVELILPTTRHAKYPANICETGPSIKWAVGHSNAQHMQDFAMSFKYLEQPEVESCEDLTSEMAVMLSRYYYSPHREKKLTVFGPFDGWNSLAILGAATLDKSMSTQYSNFILTSGLDVVSLTTHFVVVMRTFQWTTCYLVLDAGDTTKSTGDGGGLATVVAGVHALGRAIGGNVILRFVNSSQSKFEFEQNVKLLLQEVQITARVLSLSIRPDAVRRFMLVASSANMTNGEYVYSVLDIGSAGSDWDSVEWQKGDLDDEVAFQAYRSLLLQSPIIQGQNNGTKAFLADLKVHSFKDAPPECSNTTLSGKGFAFSVSAYISTNILAQVIKELISSSSSTALQRLVSEDSSKVLVEYFRNRSFQTPAGMVYFDQTGARRSATSISQYDPITRQPTAIWTASPLIFGMEQVHQPFWLLGHAPSNAPSCGFRGELCLEQNTKSGTIAAIASSVSVAAILLTAAVAIIQWKRKHDRGVLLSFLLEQPLKELKPTRALLSTNGGN